MTDATETGSSSGMLISTEDVLGAYGAGRSGAQGSPPDGPVRVQLSRTKGWRMPVNTVKVDRSTGYGNPWYVGDGRVKLHSGQVVKIGPVITLAGSLDRFRRGHAGEFGYNIGAMVRHPLFDLVLCPGAPPSPSFLRGKNLACWCKLDEPCHADVLLKLANPDQPPPDRSEGRDG